MPAGPLVSGVPPSRLTADGKPSIKVRRVPLVRFTKEIRPLFASLVGTASLGDEYRDVLHAAFANADPQIRLCAALGLSATGQHDEAVVQEILMALADSEHSYSTEADLFAQRSLAAQGTKAIPVLRAALRHESMAAQSRALQILGENGSDLQSLLPDVVQATQTSNSDLTRLAIFAKWRLDGDDHFAVERFVPLLQCERERQCGGTVDYLAKMGASAENAVPALIESMHTHKDSAVVEALSELCPHFPSTILPALKQALNEPILADRVAGVLTHIEGSQDYLLPHLARMMNAEGDPVIERHELARRLATFGPKAVPAIPGLIRALRSPSGQTRINAAEALGEIGGAAAGALPALREKQEEPRVAAATAQAAARIEQTK